MLLTNKKKEIIKHINRLQGQIDAVKKELEENPNDCIKSAEILYAASRSFASLRLLFVNCFLEEDFLKFSKKNINNNLKLKKLLTLTKG